MYLYLDTQIIMGLLCTGFLFTLILIGTYVFNQKKGSAVKLYFASKCLQTLALFCLMLRGDLSDVISIFAANSMLLIGTALEMTALFKLQNHLRPSLKTFYFACTACSVAGFLLIFIFYNQEHVRIAYYSFISAILVFPVYRLIFRKNSTLLMKLVGSLYLLVMGASFFRGISALSALAASTSLYTPGPYQLISLLSIYLLMTFGNIGFFLLLKEKTDQQLLFLANYDDLTGTLNRIPFAQKAQFQLKACARNKQPVSLLLFDIDHFKAINDTHGHQVGDRVLQELTMQIKQHLDARDLFVRYGGDEFGILLPEKDQTESTKLAAHIKQSLNNTISTSLPVKYTISIGMVTVIPNEHTELENLYETCDKALYQAKRNGRNRVFRDVLERS